jgi:hypothetical protein
LLLINNLPAAVENQLEDRKTNLILKPCANFKTNRHPSSSLSISVYREPSPIFFSVYFCLSQFARTVTHLSLTVYQTVTHIHCLSQCEFLNPSSLVLPRKSFSIDYKLKVIAYCDLQWSPTDYCTSQAG